MLTIGLCFLVALMEGLIFRRLALRRVASPRLSHSINANGLDIQRRNTRFATRRAGCGMLADRYGRKRILISSVALLVCSHWQRRLPGISPHWSLRADDRCRAGGGVAESYRPDV